MLQSGAAGQTSGFASRMEALARRHVNGLWIDGLAMSGTRSTMSISGGSVDADIVPAYLRSLSSETVLSGTRFDDFVIERPEKGAHVPLPRRQQVAAGQADAGYVSAAMKLPVALAKTSHASMHCRCANARSSPAPA